MHDVFQYLKAKWILWAFGLAAMALVPFMDYLGGQDVALGCYVSLILGFLLCLLYTSQTTARSEKFESVAFKWKVACGDHDRAVKFPAFEYCGHKHGGRGAKPEIRNIHPGSAQALCTPCGKLFALNPGVSVNLFAFCRVPNAVAQPCRECAANGPRSLLGQIDWLAALRCDGNAANIASVLELFIIGHMGNPPVLQSLPLSCIWYSKTGEK